MHEWALAEAITKTIESIAVEKNVNKIKRITIVLGELQNIDREIFEYALNELMKDLSTRKSIVVENIVIRDEKAELRCLRCGKHWKLDDVVLEDYMREAIHFIPEAIHSFTECPFCKSKDIEIVKGRGVYIEAIEF